MATTSCPNCGKPLRPGARFCGNCGHTIPATPSAQAGASPAGPDTIACPQCGKPVRVGAKFCSNCGKVLQQESTLPAMPVPPAPSVPPAPPVEKPVSEPTIETGSSTPTGCSASRQPAAGAPSARVAAPSQSQAGRWSQNDVAVDHPGIGGDLRAGRRWSVCLLLKILLAGSRQLKPALLPLFPARRLSWRRLRLRRTWNSRPKIPPTPTFTVAVVPAITVTLTATVEVTPTILLTPAVPVTGTTPSGAPAILLNDYFNDPLNINWKAWGSPRPILRSGPGDNWLELTATEKPETAGVTTRMEIANSPGNVIEFEGQLNPNYANFPLFFDWDPLQFDRGPENTTPTVLHLAIQNNRIVLQAPAANNTCQKEFKGAQAASLCAQIRRRQAGSAVY